MELCALCGVVQVASQYHVFGVLCFSFLYSIGHNYDDKRKQVKKIGECH